MEENPKKSQPHYLSLFSGNYLIPFINDILDKTELSRIALK
jgi:hypothetical protein